MSLVEKINQDLISALKNKEQLRLSTLRMLSSELKNKKIDLGKDLTDDEAFAVITKEVKKRKDSAQIFKDGSRDDLAQKELDEVEILSKYLPKELSDNELLALVKEAIAETGASTKADMGKVMGVLRPKVAGRADGAKVAQLVQANLA